MWSALNAAMGTWKHYQVFGLNLKLSSLKIDFIQPINCERVRNSRETRGNGNVEHAENVQTERQHATVDTVR